MTEANKPTLNNIDSLKVLINNLDYEGKLARIGINPNSTVSEERSFFDLSLLGPSRQIRIELYEELDHAQEVVLYNRKNEKDVIFRKDH